MSEENNLCKYEKISNGPKLVNTTTSEIGLYSEKDQKRLKHQL